jgi:murein DD-endopeptidase MepM/ murein hydrolase activator NlpD
LLLIIAWLVISMACNLPAARPPEPTPFTILPLPTDVPQAEPTLATQAAPLPTKLPTVAATMPLFSGLATATSQAAGDSPAPVSIDTVFTYIAQDGDALPALAGRFGVKPEQITSPEPIPADSLIPPGQVLIIPNVVGAPPYPSALLPDGEIIYSPSTVDFNVQAFVDQAGGYLSTFHQLLGSERLSGAEIVQHVAEITSVNPRILLAVLEFRSHWVSSFPSNPNTSYPLDFQTPEYKGLYLELSLAAKLLNMGYYGWRQGTLTRIEFADQQSVRLAPQLNAGSVAVQYLFARLYKQSNWKEALYGEEGFLRLYEKMFGDPWRRAAAAGPLFPAGLQQPALELPFSKGLAWSFTAGPHPDWNTGTPPGALDFAPITGEAPCAVSWEWARASAPGLVIYSADGMLLLDLDGDGHVQTGWVLLYLHLADRGRAAVGDRVNADDPLGHPSCEGGSATGTHVHIARRYNGEWLSAGSPIPFVLGGWTAHPGDQLYDGTLVKGSEVVKARPGGTPGSTIVR